MLIVRKNNLRKNKRRPFDGVEKLSSRQINRKKLMRSLQKEGGPPSPTAATAFFGLDQC